MSVSTAFWLLHQFFSFFTLSYKLYTRKHLIVKISASRFWRIYKFLAPFNAKISFGNVVSPSACMDLSLLRLWMVGRIYISYLRFSSHGSVPGEYKHSKSKNTDPSDGFRKQNIDFHENGSNVIYFINLWRPSFQIKVLRLYLQGIYDTSTRGPNPKFRFCKSRLYRPEVFYCCSVFSNQHWPTEYEPI
jgi:hypothetical protein